MIARWQQGARASAGFPARARRPMRCACPPFPTCPFLGRWGASLPDVGHRIPMPAPAYTLSSAVFPSCWPECGRPDVAVVLHICRRSRASAPPLPQIRTRRVTNRLHAQSRANEILSAPSNHISSIYARYVLHSEDGKQNTRSSQRSAVGVTQRDIRFMSHPPHLNSATDSFGHRCAELQ